VAPLALALSLLAPEPSCGYLNAMLRAAQQAVAADGRASPRPDASHLSPVVEYHGLARCDLMP